MATYPNMWFYCIVNKNEWKKDILQKTQNISAFRDIFLNTCDQDLKKVENCFLQILNLFEI